MNEKLFADRMRNTPKSFIREILKVTEDPEVISFAGGLPNPAFFPVKELASASSKIFETESENILQYSTTEGYPPLREYIAKRYYRKYGLEVSPEEILITNGSQQCLDLIGKVFLNKGDRVLIESPGYLGAIQAFSIFEATFQSVQLLEDGIDTGALERALEDNQVKLIYTVPNFQNPSGISYSGQKRKDVAKIVNKYDVIFIEDNPYGELRFTGENLPLVRNYLGDNAILLGSFSKVVSPGMRLGWIYAKKEIMEKIIVAKQAADLHSNYLSQRIVHQYLIDNDIDEHILKIRAAYKKRKDIMLSMMGKHFPKEIKYTNPDGGMFLWITLPKGMSALEMFELATKENVAFVPGNPFYVDGGGTNTLRLNFSNSDEKQIEEGIKRLAKIMEILPN